MSRPHEVDGPDWGLPPLPELPDVRETPAVLRDPAAFVWQVGQAAAAWVRTIETLLAGALVNR